jgi:nucleoside-diphosphate-sugar epimerase
MKALVTGGAGFIGSHLCEFLADRGLKVSIIDNLFRGKLENIEHVLNDNNHFYNIDLSCFENINVVSQLLADEKPDIIFHYAAINGTQYFYDIPGKVMEDNTMMTYCLMKAIKNVKKNDSNWKPKIIYASSSEVYGEPLSLPTKEDDITYVNINHIRDSYAESKLAGEFFVKLVSQELGIDWLILRLFNVYGPRMVGTKYGQVIPEFISRLYAGEYPLTIYGNGEHKRSFCYISDNVKLTFDLALSQARNDVFNIGNIEEISIKTLGSLIMNKMDKKPMFTYLPERDGDHHRRCPDISKLKHAITIDDFVSLDVGLNEMIHSIMG